MEKAIEVIDLVKHYWVFDKDYKIIPWLFTHKGHSKVITVLDGISFTVSKGEVVGIIGRNGAGKTTLMKIISGITFQTSGQVHVNGKIGSLIDINAGIVPDFTGRENIYHKATLMGMPRQTIDAIVGPIIEFADLGGYFDLPIRTYSAGMQSRLGFSLAVFSDPDVLLVDEVLAVGDKDFRTKSLEKTQELFRSGKSILFASHSEGMVKDFCTRVIYISEGRILFDGDVEEGFLFYNEDQARRMAARDEQRKPRRNPKRS